MTKGEELLVEAKVDVERVGERWPDALVMFVEKHEDRYGYEATRATARRLMERYAAEYFPAAELTVPVRQHVRKTLRSRQWARFTQRLTRQALRR